MRRLAIFALVLLVACSPTPTVTSTSPDSSTVIDPTPLPQAANPTLAIQPTAITGTSGLWLQILTPLDEAVVNVPQVDVTGSAPDGTVLSINDVVFIVGADGQFKTTLPLEEGPNLIEIIASNESGDETSALLTVIYEP